MYICPARRLRYNMDKILIKDLEIFAYHGVLEEEKQKGQPFFISAELYLDLREAGI